MTHGRQTEPANPMPVKQAGVLSKFIRDGTPNWWIKINNS